MGVALGAIDEFGQDHANRRSTFAPGRHAELATWPPAKPDLLKPLAY
jgi:hypothetical protein